MKRGFTLIETVVYIGLLSIIMGSALVTAYQLLQSSDTTSAHDAVGMEGDFVLRKLAWALGDAQSLSVSAHALAIRQSGGAVVTIRQGSSAIEMSEGGAYLPLTTSSVSGPQADFAAITGPDGSAGVEAAITLSGKVFYAKKYLQN
jgi:type II secretory pathway pseudopilin PulG